MGIQEIKGVGPATLKKLNKAGVKTLTDMRAMDVDKVAEKTGIDEARLREWRTEAKMLKVLDDIKGIGPATKKKLQDAGIHSVDDMARAAVHELAHVTNIAQDRLQKWQKEATRLAKQAGTIAKTEAAGVAKRTQPAREAAVAQGRKVAGQGKQVAAAAAKRGTEIAGTVRERVQSERHAETPGQGQVETETRDAHVNGNGSVTLLQKIKRIFVKA